MDKSTYTVVNNDVQQRFEVYEGNETAYLEYRYYKEDIALMHTFVLKAWKAGVLLRPSHNMLWNGQEKIKNL